MSRPNVVQAMLEGISLSQPQPKIPPELIKYLGKTYNAWNIAIPLLEVRGVADRARQRGLPWVGVSHERSLGSCPG